MYKHNYDLKVGDDDELGRKIVNIYSTVKGKYFIYHHSDFILGVMAEDESLINEDTEINKLFYQNVEFLSDDPPVRRKYLRNVAYAIKALYDGHKEAAADGLRSTYDRIQEYLLRRAIVAYLTGVVVGSLILPLALYFAIFKLNTVYRDIAGLIFNAVLFSTLGGFLSTVTGIKDIKVDLQNNFLMKSCFGSLRIAIAIISGVIVYFLIQGNVLFGFVKDTSVESLYYVMFFLSGFSEKLVFNLMLELEGRVKLKDQATS